MFGTDGTWLCHVCGRERLDKAISVRKFDAMAPMMSIKFNVRYCNDDDACYEGAQAVALKWNSGQPVSEE